MANQNAKDRVAHAAGRQSGRISWAQLRQLGVARAVIHQWVSQSYLHRRLPHVYAVGHCAPSIEGDLAEALLYAGPGAMLSHGTAAWWWDLIEKRPKTIHVSTPRRCLSLPGIVVHQRRDCPRVFHEGMPITTVSQTLLDYATTASLNLVRKALATAEYKRLLNLDDINTLPRRGRAGSTKLRKALERHQPQLAYTRSPTEVVFFELCEQFGLPLPEVNVRLHGWTVDFYWRDERVVVEVDPYGNHHTPAQVDRDRRKDVALRAHGQVVNRYSRSQVETGPQEVAADIAATLAQRRAA